MGIMNNMTNEIWKDIPGYEGYYQASSLGRIKSMDRMVNGSKSGVKRLERGAIKKLSVANNGYYSADLYKNCKRKTSSVHQLIAMTFLNHTPCRFKLVINHINFDKLDNSVTNLEIVTNRQNSNMKHLASKSKYTGVSPSANGKRWLSDLIYNYKHISLGVFDTEIEASEYYENAVIAIENGTEIKVKRFKSANKYKGVSYDKSAKKWRVHVGVGSRRFSLGYFPSEEIAYSARVNHCITNNISQ